MSPYENRLHSDSLRRYGFVSYIRPGQRIGSPPAETVTRWAELGLNNVNIFWESTSAPPSVFLYLESDLGPVEQVLPILISDPWLQHLSASLQPHPRADTGSNWLPLELINLIGPTLPEPSAPSQMAREAFVTRLKPECELSYRTLHQTNWPGVVEQMRRSQRRCWITFLIELGTELWLFTYSEYLGQDSAHDDALTAADPVTQRWWRHTEPCLDSISEHHPSWTPMDSMTPPIPATSTSD